jgi:hypothetical protein
MFGVNINNKMTSKIYITFIAENINDTLTNDCNCVKKLFEEIDFIENSYVSVYSSKKNPFPDITQYYQFSFLIMGNLKNEKFLGLYEILNNTENNIPFSIGKNKFILQKFTGNNKK